MLLALGPGVLDQRRVAELRRLREHWSVDRHGLIERRRADRRRRRGRDRRQLVGQHGPRRLLDMRNQMREDPVEQCDMILGKMARAEYKQVGDATERLGAALVAAMRDRL